MTFGTPGKYGLLRWLGSIENRVEIEDGSRLEIGTLAELRTARRIISTRGHSAEPPGLPPGRYDIVRHDGLLKCTCWCEGGIVTITPQELRDGVTHSCFRPTCKPPTNHRQREP